MLESESAIYSGFHSVVTLGSIPDDAFPDGRPFIAKHYHGTESQGFSTSETIDLLELLDRYTRLASDLGIAMPSSLGLGFSHLNGSSRYQLFEQSIHVGDNLTTRANNGLTDNQVLSDFREVLGLFRLVWENQFPIALDPPPLNFCRDQSNQLWYVDRMPPRQKLADGTIFSEWPLPPETSREFIEARYFSPLQARVIYAQWLRATAGRSSIKPQDIKAIIGEVLGDTAYQLIDIDPSTRDAVLNHPTPFDADLLRILASENFAHGQLDSATLKHLYHLTHIKPGGILPTQDEITQAAQIIANHL